MDIKALLERIRPLAEDFVRENLPEEHPYFPMIWEHVRHPLADPAGIAPEDKSTWAHRFLPEGVRFAAGPISSLMTPFVILTLEAVAIEARKLLVTPTESQLVEAISQCAKALGLPQKTAQSLAGKLKEGLGETLQSIMFSPGADNVARMQPNILPYIRWQAGNNELAAHRKPFGESALWKNSTDPADRNFFIHLRTIHFRRKPGADPTILLLEHPLDLLLILFLKYKGHPLQVADIYRAACLPGKSTSEIENPESPASKSNENTVRSYISRLRGKIDLPPQMFLIEKIRDSGYCCAGPFSFAMNLDAETDRRLSIPGAK